LNIEGNQFIPQGEFISLIPDSLYKREKGQIKLNVIRQIVLKHPFIKSVNARFGSDSDVVLELTVRHPVAQLVDSNGTLWFADKEKRIMPYKFFENFSHLPVFRNIWRNSGFDSSKLNFFVDLILWLRQDRYAIAHGLISEFIADTGNSFSAVLTDNGAKVNFGDTTKYMNKVENLVDYLNYYYRHHKNSKIVNIDLRWSRQVIVKLN
jgi:hypothetical protein